MPPAEPRPRVPSGAAENFLVRGACGREERGPMSGFDASIEGGCLVIRVPVRVETAKEGGKRREQEAKRLLTRREVEVFEAIRRRLQDKEIAAELHVSVSAVKHHVAHLLQKLGCASRWELVRKFGFKD